MCLFSRISQLPTEILLVVLLLSLPAYSLCGEDFLDGFRNHPESAPDYLLELLRLTGVNVQWRAIVHDTPGFWAALDSRHSLDINSKVIERSRQHPLSVRCYREDFKFLRVMKAFLRLAAQEAHRWRSIDFQFHEEFNARQFLINPAPMLQFVNLKGAGYEVPVNLFTGSAPCLGHMRLRGTHFDWNSAMLSGLQSLYVSVYGARTSQLVETLAASSQLVLLHLDHVYIGLDAFGDDDQNPTLIQLPNLRTLNIEAMSGALDADEYPPAPGISYEHGFAYLLRRIRAPACTTVQLGCSVTSLVGPISALSLAHLVLPGSPPIARSLNIRVAVSADAFACRISTNKGDRDRLTFIVLRGMDGRQGVEWLPRLVGNPVLKAASLTEVTFMGPYTINAGTTSTLNTFLPQIRTMTTNGVVTGIEDLLRHLSRPPWAFPQLETLILLQPSGPDRHVPILPSQRDLQEMMSGRYAEGCPQLDIGVVSRNARGPVASDPPGEDDPTSE